MEGGQLRFDDDDEEEEEGIGWGTIWPSPYIPLPLNTITVAVPLQGGKSRANRWRSSHSMTSLVFPLWETWNNSRIRFSYQLSTQQIESLSPPHLQGPVRLVIKGAWTCVVLNPLGVNAQVMKQLQVLGSHSATSKAHSSEVFIQRKSTGWCVFYNY